MDAQESKDMLKNFGWRSTCHLGALIFTCVFLGCSTFTCHRTWPVADLVIPNQAALNGEPFGADTSSHLARAEIAYAVATEAMENGDPACVDEFFHAAMMAWGDFEQQVLKCDTFQGRAADIYRSSLNALVTAGQRFGRLDPRRGLSVSTVDGWITVPLIHHGLLYDPHELNELVTVGDYSTYQLNNIYTRGGVGVPVVAIVQRQASVPFQHARQSFAATLLLRPVGGDVLNHSQAARLELYDPLRTSGFASGEGSLPLAIDSTAPMARVLTTARRNYLQSFLQPGLVTPEAEGLFMLTPYQPGKIPVICIHGLLSDRLTWANLVNEIYASPELEARYQIWSFEYPTGEPFLRSAALLRRQLVEIRRHVDPSGTDCALDQVILVGHSMGGLISKMQIAESGNQVWSSMAKCEFNRVVMLPAVRERLSNMVFFTPSPMVARVVFIGTPHRGSALAQRAVGRIGALLVEEPEELKVQHDRLVQDNPGVFSQEFTRRVPTSIDLLNPDSRLLQAIDGLAIDRSVRIHSIVGTGRWMLGSGDSDGVVPVSSATFAQADSECLIPGKHAKLTENEAVISEVLAVLRLHYRELAVQGLATEGAL
jgi:triacylglycerol esterase/lipase EstA (alpha/beta hydrolase family)